MTVTHETEPQLGEDAGRVAIRLLAEVLYVEPDTVDLDTPFPDLGLDSILAIELVAQLKTALGLEATIGELFELGTPRALVLLVRGVARKSA